MHILIQIQSLKESNEHKTSRVNFFFPKPSSPVVFYNASGLSNLSHLRARKCNPLIKPIRCKLHKAKNKARIKGCIANVKFTKHHCKLVQVVARVAMPGSVSTLCPGRNPTQANYPHVFLGRTHNHESERKTSPNTCFTPHYLGKTVRTLPLEFHQ